MKRETFKLLNRVINNALADFTTVGGKKPDNYEILTGDAALIAAITIRDLVEEGVLTVVTHKKKGGG